MTDLTHVKALGSMQNVQTVQSSCHNYSRTFHLIATMHYSAVEHQESFYPVKELSCDRESFYCNSNRCIVTEDRVVRSRLTHISYLLSGVLMARLVTRSLAPLDSCSKLHVDTRIKWENFSSPKIPKQCQFRKNMYKIYKKV